MKLDVEIFPLELRHTFTISRESKDVVHTVIVRLEHERITGYGEASPSSYYDHTAESVAEALRKNAGVIEAVDPFHYRHALDGLLSSLDGNRAALCAIDTALMDWLGKRLGVPLSRVLGVDPALSPKSSFTIGISSIEHMQEKAREAANFPILKIKLGTDDDIAMMRALRQATNATFRVDANCAWTAQETIEKSQELKQLGVEFIEQPLPREELDAMEEVFQKSALPIIADENSIVPEDVPGLIGRFHGINMKLVKCGGLLPALRMVELARTYGLELMVGCMIESSVGISAAAQIAPLLDYLDLDGAILTSNDPYTGVDVIDGTLVFPDREGHGAVPPGDAGLSTRPAAYAG